MAKRVVLCADEESLRNPQLLGLEESNLQAVSWIECCATAEECRRAARRDGIEEAWVVSCDDMEPLNVAAALKYDDPCKKVYLACAVNNGSLASRASLAKVDGVLSQACFADRFVFAKSLWDERSQKVDHGEEGSSFDCGDGCGKEPGTQAANGTTVRADIFRFGRVGAIAQRKAPRFQGGGRNGCGGCRSERGMRKEHHRFIAGFIVRKGGARDACD